jgi:hypothetical protein
LASTPPSSATFASAPSSPPAPPTPAVRPR